MNLFCETEVNWRGAEVYNRAMGITLRTFRERIMWLLDRPEHGNGISQKELAAAMGISSQYLSTLIRKESPRRPNVRHLNAAAQALNTSVSFLALATDDPSPDREDAGPIYFSPQADEAAHLIDSMSDDALRDIALDLLRVLALHDVEGDADGAPAPGTGGKLILGKILGNLKQSSGARMPGTVTK
jgi:transcriptional regulator with XRE-family HTH domain